MPTGKDVPFKSPRMFERCLLQCMQLSRSFMFSCLFHESGNTSQTEVALGNTVFRFPPNHNSRWLSISLSSKPGLEIHSTRWTTNMRRPIFVVVIDFASKTYFLSLLCGRHYCCLSRLWSELTTNVAKHIIVLTHGRDILKHWTRSKKKCINNSHTTKTENIPLWGDISNHFQQY